jgi:hypothetical protein
MNWRTFGSLSFALAAVSFTGIAEAALFRAYLSTAGNDANPCTVVQPCRLLPAALAAVANGGEIWIMDSANYNTGTVNITKSVNVVAIPGALGSIVANGGVAMVINIPGGAVSLRNLKVVDLAGAGGIQISAAAEVRIEQGVFENHATALQTNSGGTLVLKDSVFRLNDVGVFVTSGSTTQITIDNVNFENSANEAVLVQSGAGSGNIHLTIDNSVISGTNTGGTVRLLGAVADAIGIRASIMRTKIAGPGSGRGVVAAGAGTFVTLGECHVSGWDIGVETLNGPSGVGTIRSIGNNLFSDNTTDGSPSPVPPL